MAIHHPGQIRGLEGLFQIPDGHLVEVQAVTVTRRQGLDGEHRAGDVFEFFVGGDGKTLSTSMQNTHKNLLDMT